MKIKNHMDVIEKTALFNGVSEMEINNQINQIRYEIKKYQKDQLIVMEGDPCEYYQIILSGFVSATMMNISGKTLEVETIHCSGCLAPAFLFSDPSVFVVDVWAKEEVKILRIPKKDFLMLIQRNERILQNYLQQICGKVIFLSRRIKFFNMKTIEQKLAGYLLELHKKMGCNLRLPTSITALSRFFAVERPSLSRVLSEFRLEGIIKGKNKNLIIEDLAKLQQILNRSSSD